MRLPSILTLGLLCGLSIGAAEKEPGASEDDMARQLLMQAMDNQYHGRYHATLETVNETFTEGRDSLVGWAEFADDLGERRICLAGASKAFEYRSLNFGKEQWITDDNSRRIRRIANRQWKKGVFGNLLTYEDMFKLPSDFFLEYSSCKGVSATDSSYVILMTLKPHYQSFYSRIDVTLSKSPVLLRGLTFYGTHGERLKTMTVKGYKEMGGKWIVTDLHVADTDSLASVQMCFKNFSFSESVAGDKDKGRNGGMSLAAKPLSIPALGPGRNDSESSDAEEVSN